MRLLLAWREGAPTTHALRELEVRHPWRGNRTHEIEAVQVVADTIEQTLAAAQQRRHEIDLHLVDQAGNEILLCGWDQRQSRRATLRFSTAS